MFAYCDNEPVSYGDCDGHSIQPLTSVRKDSPTYKIPSIISGRICSSYSEPEWKGYDDTRIVGAGLQISGAFTVGNTTVCGGVEVIVFWDTPEAIDAGGPIVQVYVFAGGSADISGIMDSLEIDEITSYLVSNTSHIMQNPTQALGNYISNHNSGALSTSGVLVYGNKDFIIDNYSGAFITSTFTAAHLTTSWSEGTNCHAISFGYVLATTPGIGVSGSCTYYLPL